ncbi:helix-turn-helix transcriptional regulator [Pseudohongiella sp. O18]|uniref:helix-turn-helix transcriptional regulator n=1 Tax=Pseudohongiella sp. O18 TaxID=2904248 RepID=UPI001F41CE93|nr:YafY family protein [Pseudohongiella sp. O18]
MSGPTTRVLALLELLQTHGRLSGAELAQRLQVDRRTVRRYITVLEDLGIPVTTEQGRYGGYMLVAGFKLPPMMFTDEETLAVSLGLLAAQQLGLVEAAPAIASVQAKLERVMPPRLKQRARAVGETTRVILPRVEGSFDNNALLTLTHAAQSEKRVFLRYHTPDGEVLERQVDPYGLAFLRGRWYVSGYCHLRKDMRSFRLDRISGVRQLAMPFKRPANFDAAEHLRSSMSKLPRTMPVEVLLQTDEDTLTRTVGFCPGTTNVFTETDKGWLMQTRTDSYDWFIWWLVQLRIPFLVKGPDGLRDAFRSYIGKLGEAL